MCFERTPKGRTPKWRDGLRLVGPERLTEVEVFIADNLQVVRTMNDVRTVQADIAEEIRRNQGYGQGSSY
ncbi:MAG: hypothetical protein Q8R55_05485 [Candidatus Taylorbacteria bacterium]|nr:hypothetical protein [Candidatus Taylorbacteria bacterium]